MTLNDFIGVSLVVALSFGFGYIMAADHYATHYQNREKQKGGRNAS